MKKGGIKIDETVLANLRENEDPNEQLTDDPKILNDDELVAEMVAFNYFLKNSVCEVLSYKTSGGLILKLKLNDGVESPYVLTRSNYPDSKVKELLLKIVFIQQDDYQDPFKIILNGKQITRFHKVDKDHFLYETQIQNYIFWNSLDEYLEPICPGVVFSQVYDPPNSDKTKYFSKKIIQRLLSQREEYEKKVSEIETAKYMSEIEDFRVKLQELRHSRKYMSPAELPQIKKDDADFQSVEEQYVNDESVNDHYDGDLTIKILNNILHQKTNFNMMDYLDKFAIGFIAMECLTGFETLYDYQQRLRLQKDENQITMTEYENRITMTDSMARYEIARLYNVGNKFGHEGGEKIGFIHGDLHKDNLLIDPTYQYFDGIPGRVILIDFGKTTKINNSIAPINPDNSNLYEASIQSMKKDEWYYKDLPHEPYLWLPVDDVDAENGRLKYLSENRERQKEAFKEHIIHCNNVSGETQNLGGDITSHLIYPQITMKPEIEYKELNPRIKKTPNIMISDLDEESNSDEEQKNIFGILDPTNKFTTNYIDNYIATETEDNKQILEDIESKLKSKSKGGKYKPKRHKSKKNKTNRKRKTRRRKNKSFR